MAQTPLAMFSTELLEFVRSGLNARKGQWREIGEAADVPYDTLSKIARGANKEPGVLKVQRIANALQRLGSGVATA